jgi:hypothetical protein
MQGKGNPLDLEIVYLFEFFNTPGNEVAPGSGVIGKDFQKNSASLGHHSSPLLQSRDLILPIPMNLMSKWRLRDDTALAVRRQG